MKQNLRTLLLVASLMLPFMTFAQTHTVTVADGTTAYDRIPVWGNNAEQYQHTQMIYPASMLEAAETDFSMTNGSITSMTYYLSTPAAASWGNAHFNIKLMEVSDVTLDTFLVTTNATTVYSGALNGTQSTMTVTFDLPYTYQGGNLLVDISLDTKGTASNATFFCASAQHATCQGKSIVSLSNAVGNSLINYLPKTTFAFNGGTAISCRRVTDLVISEITPNSMTLTWTDALNSTGTTYTIYNLLNNAVIATNIATTTYTATGLEPNHLYGFLVEANCSATDASTRVSVAGRTNCPVLNMPYFEGFETMARNQIPSCWKVMCGSSWVHQNAEAYDGQQYLKMGEALHTVVVMPEFVENLNGKQLYFYHRPESYNNRCGELQVGYVTSLSDTSTFVALATYPYTLFDNPVLYHEAEVNYNNVPAGARVAFRHNALNANYFWYIDDVELMPQPSCMRPDNLHLLEAADNSVTLGWTDTLNGSGTTYTLYNWEDSTMVATGITGTSYTVTGLQANTSYVFAVVANCQGGGQSRWFPKRVRTLCSPLELPYIEDFEDETAGTHPLCWTHPTHTSSSANLCQVQGTSPHSGTKVLKFDYASTTGNVILLPQMELPLSQLRLRFWHHAESATSIYCGVMEVGYVTSASDTAVFVVVDTLEQSNIYSRATVLFDNAPASAVIAFRHTGRGVNQSWYWVIDDVKVEVIPSCVEVGDIAFTSMTDTTVSIAWESTGALRYQAQVLSNGAVVSSWEGTATEATLGGLTYGGDYTLQVRGICTPDTSEWNLPVAFHLAYCIPAPTRIDGEGITNVTFGIQGEVVNSNRRPATAPYYGNYTDLMGGLQAGLPSEVKITFNTYSYTAYNYGTLIWIDWNRNMLFEDDEIVYTGTSAADAPTTLHAIFTIDEEQDTGIYRMRIGAADYYFDSYIAGDLTANHNPCLSGAEYAVFMDFNVHVLPAPSCFPVTDVTVSNITDNSATLSWQHHGTATYTITHGTNILASGIAGTSYTATGLTPNHHYTFNVVANCSDEDAATPTAVEFTTECAPVQLPFVESFESNDGTFNCWNLVSMNEENVGGGNGMDFVSQNGHRMLRFSSYFSAVDYNQYAYSPVFTVSEADSLGLRIRYATYGNNNKPDNLWFGYIAGTDTVWSEQAYTTAGQEDMQYYTAVIPATATRVAIHYYGDYAYYAWIDSVEVIAFGAPEQYTVTVDYDPAMGSVVGAGTYTDGSPVSLGAIPAANHEFVHWTEADSVLSTDNPYIFTITSDRNITAVFRPTQGINDVEAREVTLYPNPATSTVTLAGLEAGSRVMVLDLNGRQVFDLRASDAELTLDLSDLAKGAYFVRVVGSHATAVRKLIVK